MAVLRLSEIHALHVERTGRLWAEGPSTDDPQAAFKPILVAVYRVLKKSVGERVMVARVPEEHMEAAEELERTLARDCAKTFPVTQATEA